MRGGGREKSDRRRARTAIKEVKEGSGWKDRAVGGGVVAYLQLYMGCVCLRFSCPPRECPRIEGGRRDDGGKTSRTQKRENDLKKEYK